MIESRALTGDDLALADVWEIAVHARPVALADSARGRMGAARELVEQAAHGRQEHTYGVNTGFGRFVSRSIPEELTEELQLRLLRSHACGVGEPYPDEIVRAAMLLRANALAKGYSGARPVTVELLMECLNRGVLPYVPSRGSVGASGDLAPLAHLALPLIAFNVNLRGTLAAAREIAELVRETGGGFPGVRALGLELPRAGLVQVSMNVEDWEAAELHSIVAEVERQAAQRGAEVVGSELVGLMPAGAAAAAAGAALRIDGFDASRVLELRLLDD